MRVLGAWIIAALWILPADAGEPGRGVVDRGPRALAARIDARLEACWAGANVRPVARADDGEFLRRASLDLVGRIPNSAEARDFLDDPNPEKRAALVDRLLDSPAYAARATTLWRQLLLPEAESGGLAGVASGGFEIWLRKNVDEGAGYDRIVREILTARLDARGDAMALGVVPSEPSPAAFFAAKGGKPETLAADSARAFLGLRLECAQCHHHPFAKWKREEFWGFAAFFAGVPQAETDGTVVGAPRNAPGLRELTIPGTATVVAAAHLDRSPPAWRPRADTRQVLAEWITAPENPYFARAAVNRTWARFFGVGLIDPVDDLDAGDNAELGALLDDLAGEFRAGGYDLKDLIRALTATRAYNLSSAVAPAESSAPPPLFARMPVRGLSSAQFIDSLARATGADVGATRARFLELFADRDQPPTEAQTSILQALTLMNGSFVATATSPDTGDILGAVAEAPYLETAGRVEVLYLAALTRRPRLEELALVVDYVDRREGEADRARALADAFWAILNGPEFRLNH